MKCFGRSLKAADVHLRSKRSTLQLYSSHGVSVLVFGCSIQLQLIKTACKNIHTCELQNCVAYVSCEKELGYSNYENKLPFGNPGFFFMEHSLKQKSVVTDRLTNFCSLVSALLFRGALPPSSFGRRFSKENRNSHGNTDESPA